MSDFLFSGTPRPPGDLRAHLAAFLGPITADIVEQHGRWGSLAVAYNTYEREVALEGDDLITVLAGDPVVRIAPAAPGMHYQGGRRRALHEHLVLTADQKWADLLDGHFALLRIDTVRGSILAVTDRFAFVPVFRTTTHGGGVMLGTHADALARAAGRGRAIDPVAAADLVVNLTSTFPYTLYTDVQQLAAGHAHEFTSGASPVAREYWAPREAPNIASIDIAAERLRDGLTGFLRAVCEEHSEVGLLLSGGEDSRAVLGAVPKGVQTRPFIYADWASREVRVASAAARAYDATLNVGWRKADHYEAGFPTVAAMVGSSHLFSDVHGFGFEDALGLRDLPVTLGGLSSDSLLKAVYATPHGKRRPVSAPREPQLREDILREVDARRTRWRDQLAELRPETADEWTTLWPFSMRKHGGNLHGNRRLFRVVEAYHGGVILDVAAHTPNAMKLNRQLFLRAVRPFLARSWHVPHTEYRFPYFSRTANAALLPLLAAARGARALASGELRARHRPWPKWDRLAASDAMAVNTRADPPTESPIADIFTTRDAGEVARATSGWYSLRRLMLAQLAYVSRLASG